MDSMYVKPKLVFGQLQGIKDSHEYRVGDEVRFMTIRRTVTAVGELITLDSGEQARPEDLKLLRRNYGRQR